MSGIESSISVGNSLPLKNIPVGTQVHCIEMKPGKGAQIARSAGTVAQIAALDGQYATLKLKSGEMRKIHSDCKATVGEVGNSEHNLQIFGKAGAKNAAYLAAQIIGVSDPDMHQKLIKERADNAASIIAKDAALQESLSK